MRKPNCVVPSRAVCAVFCPLALGLLCGGGVPLADLEDVRDVLRASQAGASPATNAVWLDAGVFPWPARGPLAALAAEAYPFPDPARIHLFASEDAATRNVVVADAAGAPLAFLPDGTADRAPSPVGVRLTLDASGDGPASVPAAGLPSATGEAGASASAAVSAPASATPLSASVASSAVPVPVAGGGMPAATNVSTAAFVPAAPSRAARPRAASASVQSAAGSDAPSVAAEIRAVRVRTDAIAVLDRGEGGLFYDFAEAPTNGVVADRSGNGHDGAASGCDWTSAGRFHGGAMAFDSNADSVNAGTDLDFPAWERYTVSLWFLHDGGGDKGPQYGHKMLDKTDWYHDWHLHLHPPGQEGGGAGEIGLTLYEARREAGFADNSRNYADGAWHHVAVVRDGTYGEFWVDGTLHSSTSTDMMSVTNSAPVCVGNSYSGDSFQRKGWHGLLDEIRILHAEGALRLGVYFDGGVDVRGGLDVAGGAAFGGAVYARPLGDLSCGAFTNGVPPAAAGQ